MALQYGLLLPSLEVESGGLLSQQHDVTISRRFSFNGSKALCKRKIGFQ